MNKILITGTSGFIGFHLATYFLKKALMFMAMTELQITMMLI